jgi:hypothetical protein
LYIDSATVPRRILYQEPYREIIHDMDGSLTMKGADTYATYFYPHLNHTECDHDPEMFDGIVCDPTVKLRRLAFYGYTPGSLTMQPIKVAKWSEEFEEYITANETEYWEWCQDVNHTHFSILI